jgi:hypothetical protein
MKTKSRTFAKTGSGQILGKVETKSDAVAAAETPFGPVCAGPDCDRVHFNAIVTDQELAETYLPAFTKVCKKPTFLS